MNDVLLKNDGLFVLSLFSDVFMTVVDGEICGKAINEKKIRIFYFTIHTLLEKHGAQFPPQSILK